jgi:hypothetical protein
MAYYFLRDSSSGASSAEREWLALDAQYPYDMDRVLAHLVRVESIHSLEQNAPLKTATPIGSGMYYWDVRNVFVIYYYDGQDLVVVLVGNKNQNYQESIAEAQRRI